MHDFYTYVSGDVVAAFYDHAVDIVVPGAAFEPLVGGGASAVVFVV